MCFDLYTLYPPGLTVIIYDGLGHTPVRTLFKAQIYLNKNKNKRCLTYLSFSILLALCPFVW